MGGTFVGNKPLGKVDPEELKAGANIEHKLCLVIKIDLFLIDLREDGGQYRLINKLELENEAIEVKDENGGVGVIVGWQKNDEAHFPFGLYTAQFEEEVIKKEDYLMMQEPTWEFRKAQLYR